MLESMGFDGNKAAQYLEEDGGNTVRVIEKLLQAQQAEEEEDADHAAEEESAEPDHDHFGYVHEHEPNQKGEGNIDDGDDDDDEEEEDEEEEEEHEPTAVMVAYHHQLSKMVDEMMADLADFFKEVPLNLVCSKLMIVFWCILIVVIPVILLHHSCDHSKPKQATAAQAVCPSLDQAVVDNVLPLRDDFVYIQTARGEYLYLTPDGEVELDQDKTGKMAIWKLEVHGNAVKIQNKETSKYLRLHWTKHPNMPRKKRSVDCGGTGGVWTVFNVQEFQQLHQNEFSMVLKSNQVNKSYLGFGATNFWDYFTKTHHVYASRRWPKSVWTVQYVKEQDLLPQIGGLVREEFTTPYSFADDVLFGDDEVVIKHLYHYDSYLQLESILPSAANKVALRTEVNTEGGIWSLQRLQDHGEERILVKVMNKHSGKYLRIVGDEVTASGNGGKFTLFRVISGRIAFNSPLFGATLESVEFPGKCIAFRPGGKVQVTEECTLDVDSWLVFMTRARSLDKINAKNEREIVALQRKIEMLEDRVQRAYRQGYAEGVVTPSVAPTNPIGFYFDDHDDDDDDDDEEEEEDLLWDLADLWSPETDEDKKEKQPPSVDPSIAPVFAPSTAPSAEPTY